MPTNETTITITNAKLTTFGNGFRQKVRLSWNLDDSRVLPANGLLWPLLGRDPAAIFRRAPEHGGPKLGEGSKQLARARPVPQQLPSEPGPELGRVEVGPSAPSSARRGIPKKTAGIAARVVSNPLDTLTTAPIRNDPRARAEFSNAPCRKLITRSDNSNDVAATT